MVEHYSLFLTATKIMKCVIKAVENYPNALELVPECYKTQEMRDKFFNTNSSWIL